MKHIATCSCGQLKLEYNGEINKTSICHCFECQKRTGSTFGLQMRVEQSKVQVTGESTVFWEVDGLQGSTVIAAGALTNPQLPSPTFMVYGNRMHHWLKMPDTAIEYFDS